MVSKSQRRYKHAHGLLLLQGGMLLGLLRPGGELSAFVMSGTLICIDVFMKSGKTLAFGLPALARLVASPEADPPSTVTKKSKSKTQPSLSSTISILVLAPTRELAIQTHETLCSLGEPFGLTSVAVFGGVDKEPQKRALKKGRDEKGLKTRMVVGTPGRILDLVNEGACDLSRRVPKHIRLSTRKIICLLCLFNPVLIGFKIQSDISCP